MNENIPCRELSAEQIDTNFEIIFLKITMWMRKWLIIGLYKPSNQKEEYFFKNLGVVLNNYLSKYENIILLGDFNLTTSNKYLPDFMTLFNLESLINTPTCFQSEKMLFLFTKKGPLNKENYRHVSLLSHITGFPNWG